MSDLKPTFSNCVQAVRRASGDRRTFVERRQSSPDGVVFKYTDGRQYRRAADALHKVDAIPLEQATYDGLRFELRVSYRTCVHCGQFRHAHLTAKMQCLFASTRYEERRDGGAARTSVFETTDAFTDRAQSY